ncbi:TIGR03067 domain-containing protein [Lignipirellula cremea]|uniref:TIGR03067 domain-containing protein n=1 Tax=Lignipirellula cremea TaxID=2528010 RepID=A0A518E501_9BACT|nr:TIGR03067 domain-containing protein [Lignipirellula cremea]QDU99175.1 hypothetical protein Pla8534_70880 [Lignipirellula cremea]
MYRRLPCFLLLALIAVGAHAAQADDQQAIQGTWQPKSATISGQVLEPETVQSLRLTFEGNQYHVVAQGRNDKGQFTLKTETTPAQIDIVEQEGPSKGKTTLGLYSLADDELTICFGLEQERPLDLTSEEGSNRLLIVYERVKQNP